MKFTSTQKSRFLVLIVGSVGVIFINLLNIIVRTFTDKDVGIVLVKYTVFGRELYLYKRSIQRSIFSTILCFSASGIYTLVMDKKMKYLMFGTGYVNRETGDPALKIS